MQVYLLLAAGGVFLIFCVIYYAAITLKAVGDGVLDSMKSLSKKRAERANLIEKKKAQEAAAAEAALLEHFRQDHPVRMVNIPNIEAFRTAFQLFDRVTVAARAFRPQLNLSID